MKKYTAGPWGVNTYSDEDIEIEIVAGYEYKDGKHTADWIADLHSDNISGGFETMEANAHLIAAAPELFEALEMAMIAVNYQKTDLNDTVRDFIEAAIKKAKGE